MKVAVTSIALMLILTGHVTGIGKSWSQSREKASPQSETGVKAKTDSVTGPGTVNQPEKVQLSTNLVSLTVSVTDQLGRFVTGLGNDHFQVFNDKVEQEITHFSDEDAPISLGIVYDVSGSMTERMGRSIRALRRFIETSHQDDHFFLVAFNNRARLVQDFTTSGDQIANHLTFVKPEGPTALYDAVYLAVEKVQQGQHTKKVLLLISDGQDNSSRYSYNELRNRAKEADIQIYAIGITDPVTDQFASLGRATLEEITRMTGGRAFFPNAFNESELIEVCTRIALELRHQYSIGFYPTSTGGESKWHKVKVKVNPPKGLGRLSLTYKDRYRSFRN